MMPDGALTGLRVVEYAEHISGPYCTKLMADLGAEVIKVEPPVRGDSSRHYGPFPGDVPNSERSGLFLYLNTNKLGITLDLNKATGRSIFKKLLLEADVFVQNHPPKQIEDWGLDYESQRQVTPRLVMTSIRPLGNAGPYKNYKAYSINSAAASGVMNQIGKPTREPIMPPEDQMGYQGAIHGAAATMIAVWRQHKSGKGQHVDVSEAECMGNMLIGLGVTAFVLSGQLGMRAGHRVGHRIYPYTVLPCKDGFVSMIALENHQWDRFVKAVGEFEWAEDPRFADRTSRGQHADELDSLLAPWLMSHTKEEIFALCRANRIPFTPVCSTDEVFESEHLKERNYFQQVDHPETGPLSYPGAPYKLSETPWHIRFPAPRLGEHNEMVLCGKLGFSREQLVELKRSGVI